MTASDLTAVGVSVSWPTAVGTTTLSPGATLVVKVRRSAARGSDAAVVVRVDRIMSDGDRSRLLRRVVSRSGRVSYRLPKAPGRRYAVAVRAAGKTLRTVIHAESAATNGPSNLNETTDGPTPSPSPSPAPSPTPAPVNPLANCGTDAPAYTLTASAGPYHAGDAVPYTLQSTSSGCLFGGLGYTWQRLDAGTWVDVRLPFAFPAIGIVVQGYGTRQSTIQIPADTVPGHYRFGVNWSDLPASSELDVVA